MHTCVRLQEFYISARNSDGCGPLGSWIEFPEMRVLHFDFGQGLPLNRQLEFIQRCPKLKSLNWTTVYRLPIEDVSLVLSTYCRQLRELSFVLPILDSDIALILNSCCEITSFHDIDANFGRLAFQSLEQHFSSLTHLNVGTRSSMTSAMVQGIMSSCPSLLSLTAPFLDTLDILGNIEALSGNDGKAEITEAICSRGWVCLSLRHLEVRICGLGEEGLIERQRLILQQLAKLEKLEVLSINSIDKLGNWKNDGLDLRLKAGLDILASLRRLEKLSFMGVSQQMNEQDIQWILQAWPRLRSIQGNTHFARSRRHQLEILLEKHHIKLGKLTVLDIDDNDDDDDEDDLFFWDIVQA
ncbi:hypothetical protein BGX27_008364 [Mortierella sp. AM989]|nr:hypothetical protein BGX27_008364 [Mortierella sp. AM989]